MGGNLTNIFPTLLRDVDLSCEGLYRVGHHNPRYVDGQLLWVACTHPVVVCGWAVGGQVTSM